MHNDYTMLIGIDANEANLTRNRVGVNEYAFNLLHALYDLDTLHDFVIYLKTSPLDDLPKARGNWQYRVIPFPKLWTQTRLPWDLFTHTPRPDVFFSATHYAPRWSPVPTVVAIMDLGFLYTPDQFTARDFNQLKSWTAYSVQNATKVVAISNHTRSEVVRVYHKNPRDVITTLLGYNAKLFKPTRDTKVLAKYGIKPPYFLFLSSLKPSKNIEGLLKAYALGNFKEKLVIAGKKAWLYDQIFQLVNQLGLTDRVIFTGFVPDIDKPVLMTYAQAFVMPSFYEGFSITLLEAMACATPVVASDIPSQTEVAGGAGIYVDPYSPDSIATGLQTSLSSKRRHFINLGRDRVKLFNWATTARQTLSVIESAASK